MGDKLAPAVSLNRAGRRGDICLCWRDEYFHFASSGVLVTGEGREVSGEKLILQVWEWMWFCR